MKKLALFIVLSIVLFSCGNQKSQNQSAENVEKEVVVITVDELYQNASDLADSEVMVKGTVMHVCQHGGQRCFLMGSNEDINIRIEAGEKIGAFSQELMGSELEVVGILKEVKTEAEAHNPGEHEGATEEDTETQQAHKVIADAQKAAEVVYYIQGLTSKEI